MKPNILYLSDLDGTLLNADARLSAYTSSTLNALMRDGLLFSVATARSPASSQKILAPLRGLRPIVLMNGSLIYNRETRVYEHIEYIPFALTEKIIHTLHAMGLTAFMYELRGGIFSAWHEVPLPVSMEIFKRDRIERYQTKYHPIKNLCDHPREHIIYFTLMGPYDAIHAAHAAMQDILPTGTVMYNDVYAPPGEPNVLWFLEIQCPGASKKTGALRLKALCGCDLLVGFGDNVNDLPLFEACDYTVAPENANPLVKAAAHEVTGANTEDGVVRWLLHNVSKRNK
jgi:Cof subfamily protein (haloacid dehalogenase superfamily)